MWFSPISFLAALSVLGAATDAQRVVCYFINWARYRNGDGKFLPEDMDANLCTHINYAFAVLDPVSHILKSSDPWSDIDLKSIEKITGLKSQNPYLKILLSLGGWTDSAGNKYSQLVGDSTKRANFIRHAIPFLKQHGFDGLDLDWEYPRCWQGDCNAGPPQDKQNFATFVRELRQAFDRENPKLLLTAAVIAGGRTIDEGYDVPSISRDMDFINIMTYDFSNYMKGKTAHHAQRAARPGDGPTDFNVIDCAKQWASKGAPTEKLVIGVPAYGRSFRLVNSASTGLGAPTNGPGSAGQFTGEPGFLGYYEICRNLRQGWKKDRDSNAGPWITNGQEWVGYDDPQDIALKARWAVDNYFGGVMVWDASMDDFRGTCCKTKYPILKAMQYGTFKRGENPQNYGCP